MVFFGEKARAMQVTVWAKKHEAFDPNNVLMLWKRRNSNPYCAGIDFSRQNLTSADVRIWRKVDPAL